ncbi:thiamine pyrophosphate-dependent enzyme [Pauljensenia sp. UMB1235]|uniref:alpha-ketoacid dehydrogenase subunit alpha/beta n=1 Tax=unclassified Pauljensenia TaxID=2908895 RepID=UPI00254FB548|nr:MULTISPECIES: alpha-ketoacid dehydrogenase subunit alpha/beta [unclassified Pauljensenia]MDK6401077.1 thiamine pyrophosphate-dependent enzyme [Pauljensenia sp. UMB9872]MDK7173655.1 thiamine pyrophosphate-dependent enzyme [Pauljensenia sp. UMB1235]
MTKSLIIDPSQVRAAGHIQFPDIPVNQYKFDLDTELDRYGKDGMVNMLHDMIVVRTFESMLDSIKKTGEWRGIAYNHRGPAHLGIGQESAYVGQASVLSPNDQVFGSHRSHGEILAKCYSAMRQIENGELENIMKTFLDGETLSFAEKIDYKDTKDLTENFILFGALAEIFARKAGFNRGLGGSMHTFFLPFGSYPNNAIVGGSAPVANGAALFKRINRKPGIVVSNVGDAALACGPVWEAMNFASMDQFRTLWREEDGGNPPILFNFFNNFYGMGGQTFGETMGYDILARVGAALNPEAMHAERVDGINPLAVADAVSRKKKILEEGRGPVLMDTITYRFSGHSPSDASSYRTKDEVELWENVDCITTYSDLLISNGLTTQSDIEDYTAGLTEKLVKVLKLAIDEDNCPRVADGYIDTVMFSNTPTEKMEEGEAEIDLEDNPRVKAIAKKIRTAKDENGKPVSKMKMYQFRDGLFEAMLHRFKEDPTMAAWGEENRDWGGAFAVYRGLTEALPYRRLFNSPIAEASIVGAGVGYAMAGGRAVVELMYCDFLGRSGDEVFNQMAKWQSMSAGLLKMPLVLRVSVGNKYGAQHSQDWSALTAHIPGLKVYFPTTPTDAKGMLNLALRGTDPVVFFESQLLYDKGEEFEPGGVPEGYYETPEGEPAIRREGTDITIAGYGATIYRALEAADVLQEKYGMSAEVIDLRFVAPLNYDKLIESVKKTGRLLLTSDAVERGNFLNTVAANVQTLAFDALDAPIAVVGSRNGITPGPELESYFFPQVEWIIDAIHERIVPLPGHVPSSNQTEGEIARRNRLGL